jgi:outer membrane protein TolC
MRFSYFSFVLLWGMVGLPISPAVAQTAAPMTLEQCIQYGLDNHPDIKVARLAIVDADWRVKENKATGFPQASLSVGYTGFLQRGGLPSSALSFGPSGPPPDVNNVPGLTAAQAGGVLGLLGSLFQSDPDSKIYFAPVHNVAGTIGVNQLLFNNSYLVARKAARYYREYVDIQMAVAKNKVSNAVRDAYLPALLLSESVATLDKNIKNLDKIWTDTKAITQAGFAEQLDVDRLELSLSNLRSERSNLLRQREIVVNALKMAMGMPIGNAIEPSDDVAKLLAADAAGVDMTSAANFMNRPEYLQLLKGRELSAMQVDLYRKPYLPTVAGFLQYQPQLQGGFGNKDTDNFKKWYFIPSAVAGINVSVPLWDSGLNKARKERAILAVQTIEAQKEMLENAFTLELDVARRQYLNAQERVANQQKNLELAQRIYDTTQKKYAAGIGSSFEITQAEAGLYSAQQNVLQAQYDLLSARTGIKKALGN